MVAQTYIPRWQHQSPLVDSALTVEGAGKENKLLNENFEVNTTIEILHGCVEE